MVSVYDSLVGLDPHVRSSFVDWGCGDVATETDPRVVFPYPQGEHLKHLYKYCVIARAFELRGYEPLFVLCDRVLPDCSIKPLGTDNDCGTCELCSYRGERMIEAFGHEWIPLSDLVDDPSQYHSLDGDDGDLAEYGGVDLHEFATYSVRKVKRKYTLSGKRDERALDQFLRAGVLLVDAVDRLVEEYDVRAMISHDDKYCWSGVPLIAAAHRGVYAYSSTLGWHPNSIVLGRTDHRDSFPHFEESELIERFLAQPLDEAQEREVDSLLENRRAGTDVQNHYSADGNESIDETAPTTVGMFTNLIWDASIDNELSPFSDIFDWIGETIEHFVDRDDARLVVKTHPAETIRGTNESVGEWISDHFDVDRLDSLDVLPPSTGVNTYRMIDDIDAAIVFNSTVGIEAAYYGTPVVVAGDTHYRGLDVTYDPDRRSEYFELLQRIETLEMTERMRSRAERYAYFFFVGKHLPFHHFPAEDTREEFAVVSDSEVGAGNETFDQLVERTVRGDPVLDPDLNWLVDGGGDRP